jgi:hypothetical protein
VLSLQKTESVFRKWYEKNRERLSEKRKKLYAEDPEYRQRLLEASRKRTRLEPPPTNPPGAPISSAQAAERTGISISTLREWRKKKLFPEPKYYRRTLWFSEKQVLLLTTLKQFFGVYGKRRGNTKQVLLKGVIASISANWD